MATGPTVGLHAPVVHPSDRDKAMQEEARRRWQKSIVETGADPLWWKLMRNPRFRAAVEAEDRRIYLESLDELAKRRGGELGILEAIEAEYQARLRAPGRQLAAKIPENLLDLMKKVSEERATGSTYGAEAEYRLYQQQFRRARERGDRLILLGKWRGASLKALLRGIYPDVDLSGIEDGKHYGGDLMIIGLERREMESWIRHLSLWGMNQDVGVLTRTIQMKWGETADPAVTEHQITYAGIQLSGARDELALPFGHREISIGVLNPTHPWALLDATNAADTLIPALQRAFARGKHGTGHNQLDVPKGGLYPFVTRIVIRTTNWTFRLTVTGTTINLVSSTPEVGQHASLLSLPRPGKGAVGEQEGTLVFVPKKNAYFIQGSLRRFALTEIDVRRLNAVALLSGSGTSARVLFTLGRDNLITGLRKKPG
jgi:hypothetical protein